ncbi:MAG: HAMP domain-containing histidine kinase [Lachnospiraceae bacterium]|nr:HAMP domain-containing histidine kinase [Lachnospiraceae bacterium]
MNRLTKKPVLWRMLLKRVAIMAVTFIIIYVSLNYVAYNLYEVAYTNGIKSDMDSLVTGIDNPELFSGEGDTKPRLDLKLGISCDEGYTDGIRYIRMVDIKSNKVIADSSRRAYMFIRNDDPAQKSDIYICDINLFDTRLLQYEDDINTFHTYSMENGEVTCTTHTYNVDPAYYAFKLKDVYIKGDQFLPGKLTVTKAFEASSNADYKEPEFIEEVDLTPNNTEGYEHITDSDKISIFVRVGTNENDVEYFGDWLDTSYLDREATKTIQVNDGSMFGSVLVITSSIYVDENDNSYIIESFSRSSYESSFGFILNAVLEPLFVIIFIISIICGIIRYKKLSHIYEQEEYRRTLMNSMAHDLKSPLAAMRGYAENLKENLNSEKKDHYADCILKNTDYMNSLISDNLALLKLEYDTSKPGKDKVDLIEVSKELIDKYMPLLGERGVSVNIDGSYIVKGNRAQLSTAVENLISNAVRYVNDKGEIKIDGSKKEYTLSNTASSLPDVEAKELWKPFVKGDDSRSNENGSGLGLSIAKNIFDRHKFKSLIRCDNIDEVNRFTITIRS